MLNTFVYQTHNIMKTLHVSLKLVNHTKINCMKHTFRNNNYNSNLKDNLNMYGQTRTCKYKYNNRITYTDPNKLSVRYLENTYNTAQKQSKNKSFENFVACSTISKQFICCENV